MRNACTSSLDQGVFSRGKVGRTDLWRSCRALYLADFNLDEPGRAYETQSARTDSTTPASTGGAFSTQSAFHRQSAPGDFSSGTRHHTCSFAAGGTASDALSLLLARDCSREEKLDPQTITLALRPGSLRTARRLSTSAIEHDCRAQLPDRSNPAHRAQGCPWAQRCRRVAVPLSGRGQPSCHRSGACVDG
jgi:hypothetical protein